MRIFVACLLFAAVGFALARLALRSKKTAFACWEYWLVLACFVGIRLCDAFL